MEVLSQLIVNSLVASAVYCLMALGFNLIFGAARFFNLSHGVVALIAAYCALYISRDLGLNLYAACAVGVLAAGLSGWIFDKAVYLRLRRKRAKTLILLVASLGIFTIAQAGLELAFTNEFKQLRPDGFESSVYSIAGGVFTDVQALTVATACVVAAIYSLTLGLTPFGRTIKAVSDDEGVARIVGIDPDKVIGRLFFIGSVTAGLAGVLTGLDTGMVPTMSLGLLLKGVIAAIIGGVGSINGAIIGSLLLGFVENFGIWKIPGEWKDAIAFGLLILFLIFRPRGILHK